MAATRSQMDKAVNNTVSIPDTAAQTRCHSSAQISGNESDTGTSGNSRRVNCQTPSAVAARQMAPSAYVHHL